MGALAVIARQRRRPRRQPEALQPKLQALDELPPYTPAKPPTAVPLPHADSVVPTQQVAQLPVATAIGTVIQQKTHAVHAVI